MGVGAAIHCAVLHVRDGRLGLDYWRGKGANWKNRAYQN